MDGMQSPRDEVRIAAVRRALAEPVPLQYISRRQGPGGKMVPYISGTTMDAIANHVLGFEGWNTQLLEQEVKSLEMIPNKGWRCEVHQKCRITLSPGFGAAYREDIGTGINMSPTKEEAMSNATKSAVTNGYKRALAQFGNCFSAIDGKYSKVPPPGAPSPAAPSLLHKGPPLRAGQMKSTGMNGPVVRLKEERMTTDEEDLVDMEECFLDEEISDLF